MYYPLLLSPIYKKMVWGGGRIKKIRGEAADGLCIGESWDVSCRPDDMSLIRNGAYEGASLENVILSDPSGWLGKGLSPANPFPLLVKTIDACDNLSVQVHPGDADAFRLGGERLGKNEMWYVLDAPEYGYIILGVKEGVDRRTFGEAIRGGSIAELLNRLPVRKGDVIMIPEGTVHALTKGVMVIEIQQNSDVTFRIFDYNRKGLDGKPRPLHIEQALEVADFSGKKEMTAVNGVAFETGFSKIIPYVKNSYFSADKYVVTGCLDRVSDPERFCIYTNVAGEFMITSQGMETNVKYGESVFIPAGLGNHAIKSRNGAECLASRPAVTGKEEVL